MSLEIVAALSKVIFISPLGDYVVGEFIDTKSARRFRATGKINVLEKQETKQSYRLFGDWQTQTKYGETFSVCYAEPVRPDHLGGIVLFLAQNVKGVGEKTAQKMLQHLDVANVDGLVEVCRAHPEKIREFFKSRTEIAGAVISLLTGNEIYRSIMIFLHEHNIPSNFATRIFDRYGSNAVDILTENPYRLISDFRNVGFKKADLIAQKLGLDPFSPFRIEAAFVFALQSAAEEGHCCLPRDLLVEQARQILGGGQNPAFSTEFILNMLRQSYKRAKELNEEKFVVRAIPDSGNGTPPPLFFLRRFFDLENSVARACLGILALEGLGTEHLEQTYLQDSARLKADLPDVPWALLTDEQFAAVQTSIHRRLLILTGGPGCGKTFVLKAVHKVQCLLKRKVALCAPTGLAAKRMGISIGVPAVTIHKLLRLGRGEGAMQESDNGVLEGVDTVIVDEASMLGVELFHLLLEALGPSRRLILVGDVDQLPSVSAGNCLRDLMASNLFAVSRLTRIFRQSNQSPIPAAAREIINGKRPQLTPIYRLAELEQPEPLAIVPCKAPDFFEHLIDFVKRVVPNIFGLDPLRDCQILVPMRRGDTGQDNINKILQEALNPRCASSQECQLTNGILRTGDKVIQTRNNYEKEVFNGDLGFCRSISIVEKSLKVEIAFYDRTVLLEDEDLDDIQLCYAMTIHKSQGSEFPLCIMPMFGAYFTMLDRNLFYTALTRASRYAIIFGEDWAIRRAISNVSAVRRYTSLEHLLRSGCAPKLMTPL